VRQNSQLVAWDKISFFPWAGPELSSSKSLPLSSWDYRCQPLQPA
jgi:hypothetical protein